MAATFTAPSARILPRSSERRFCAAPTSSSGMACSAASLRVSSYSSHILALMLFCCSCIPSLFSCRRSSSLAAASRREMTSLFSLERILRRISSWSRCASASLISRRSSSISLLPLCAPAVICSISSRMASLSFFSCSCRSRKAARAASLPLCWPSICSMAIWTASQSFCRAMSSICRAVTFSAASVMAAVNISWAAIPSAESLVSRSTSSVSFFTSSPPEIFCWRSCSIRAVRSSYSRSACSFRRSASSTLAARRSTSVWAEMRSSRAVFSSASMPSTVA